jgi:uncharacterized protein (UPF0332 family)
VTDDAERERLMGKAERALDSARLLLAAGDVDGACNRAYYAMFDAARATLSTLPGADGAEAVRTHGGLIVAFGLQLIKTGRLPRELGRMLNRAEDVRLLADYTGASVELADARALLADAEAFVAALRAHLVGGL